MTTQNNKIDRTQYLQFLNAVITCSDHDRAEAAFKKAIDTDTDILTKAIEKVVTIGELTALRDYLNSRPSRVTTITKLTNNLFGEEETSEVVDEMLSLEDGDDPDEGDFYYDQGDDSDGH